MNTQINKSSISKSISYLDYLALVNAFAKANKTSGFEQTENQKEYTRLNASRMRRIEKTLSFTPAQLTPFGELSEKQTWLVITETWCGDGGQIIPVLNKIAESNPGIDLRIVFRDENPKLMDPFLTKGARSIPKLIRVCP